MINISSNDIEIPPDYDTDSVTSYGRDPSANYDNKVFAHVSERSRGSKVKINGRGPLAVYDNVGDRFSDSTSGFASVSPVRGLSGRTKRAQHGGIFRHSHLHYLPFTPPKTLQRLPSHHTYDDISNRDERKPRQKCSIKKSFKYSVWVIIFLGISGIVALLSISQQKTDEVESLAIGLPEKLIEIKNINHTIVDAFKKLNGSLNSMRFESQNLANLTEKSLLELKDMLKHIKTNLPDYILNSTCGTNQGGQFDGNCTIAKTGSCVNDCDNICNGDFQSCSTCSGYVTCANRVLFNRPCPGSLVWDDNAKQCEATSISCDLLGTS